MPFSHAKIWYLKPVPYRHDLPTWWQARDTGRGSAVTTTSTLPVLQYYYYCYYTDLKHKTLYTPRTRKPDNQRLWLFLMKCLYRFVQDPVQKPGL